MTINASPSSSLLEAPSFPTGSAGLGPAIKRWTADEYHRMIDLGLIMEGAPIELIDGMLVYKDRRDRGGGIMTQGDRHNLAIAQLVELSTDLAQLGFHIRIQSTLSISESHEPEPDGLVLPGRPIQYRGRLPRSDEAALVIEVADSSLGNDRSVKSRMYSTAAIPHYWIINLRENVLETYSRPDPLLGQYLHRRDYRVGESVNCELPGNRALLIAIARLIADAQ